VAIPQQQIAAIPLLPQVLMQELVVVIPQQHIIVIPLLP
jgi:hypothetical protein